MFGRGNIYIYIYLEKSEEYVVVLWDGPSLALRKPYFATNSFDELPAGHSRLPGNFTSSVRFLRMS